MACSAHFSVLLSGAIHSVIHHPPIWKYFFLISYLNIVKITTCDIRSSGLTSSEIILFIPVSYKHSFIFHPLKASPAGIFQAKSFVLFKGKYILSALIALCSAAFSHSNDASFLHSHGAKDLHISLILQESVFPFIPPLCLHTVQCLSAASKKDVIFHEVGSRIQSSIIESSNMASSDAAFYLEAFYSLSSRD